MKFKEIYIVVFSCFMFVSCTSNTIYEEPKDLIQKDTMALLLKDMYLAVAAKNVTNKNSQRRFSYIPLVYEKYKIDSARFQRSNLYYTSKIDIYEPLLEGILKDLEADRKLFARQKKVRDSIRKDSISKAKKKLTQKNRRLQKSFELDPKSRKKKEKLRQIREKNKALKLDSKTKIKQN